MASVFSPRGFNTRQVYEEIAQRFREELDYRLEAEHQSRFRELMADEHHIHIPEVIAERSTGRVLTSELCRGATLEQAAETDAELRRHYCEVLWRFVYKGNLVGGVFNADPHPGNYLFGDDGRITFLDFGCVQPIPHERLLKARELHRSAHQRDEARFREVLVDILQTRGGAYEREVARYVRRCFEPLFQRPFHMTRDYVSEVVQEVNDMKWLALTRDASMTPLPEGMVFMNRLQFGFYSVLARLDVPADYTGVERQLYEAAGI
jgi:predicted unusual protein kinase regulating ubiquinone biosynthesis (AarF/ABC1/UbiB family)